MNNENKMKSLKVTTRVHQMLNFFKNKYRLKSMSNFFEQTIEIIEKNKDLRNEIVEKCDKIKNSDKLWYKDMYEERQTFSESAIETYEEAIKQKTERD